jgi:hypothetical protein
MHDDVDPAETIAHGFRDDGAAFGSGYIRRDELIGMSNIFGPRARCGEHGRACFAQGRNDRFADTLGAAGDERALALELQVIAQE